MTDSHQLLADYARTRSEAAFAELVRRYIDLVYSTAVRLTDGDMHLAEDVSQTVFLDLAHMARRISSAVMLGGWLHRHTCFVAAKMLRANRRRQNRERLSVEMNDPSDHSEAHLKMVAPILDEAINALGSADREAILRRFFAGEDFRAIGQALGSTEEAARKRVTRALEKLQLLLGKRGVALSAAGLGSLLVSGVVTAAPAGLAISVSNAVATAAAGTGSAWTLLNFMASAKMKAGLLGSIVAASTISSLVIHHESAARLRAAEVRLELQTNLISQAQSELDRLSRVAALRNGSGVNARDELLRMREDVAALRRQTNDLIVLRQDNNQLQAALRKRQGFPSTNAPARDNPEIRARSMYCRDLAMAMMLYASDNQEQFPSDLGQASKYIAEVIKEPSNLTPAQFEIVYHGSRDALTNYAHPNGILLLREKVPWRNAEGKWFKGYASTDGGGFIHSEPNGDFEAFEKRRILAPEKK
jgi:RNA polymerase sigma factor (sigma-70 family)